MTALDEALKTSPPAPRRRYRLRTLLLLLNLTILSMPLLGLWSARVYENEQLQRTEAELLMLDATLTALWTQILTQQTPPADHPDPWPPGQAPTQDPHKDPSKPKRTLNLNRLDIEPAPLQHTQAASGDMDPHLVKASAGLRALMPRLEARTMATAWLLDHQGRVLASTQDDMGHDLAHMRPEVTLALQQGKPQRLLRRCGNACQQRLKPDRRDDMQLVLASPLLYQERVIGVLLLSSAPRSHWAVLRSDLAVVMTIILVLIAAVIGQSLFISRAIVTPVHELIAQAAAVARGDRSAMVPLAKPVTYEVQLLSEAIVSMARSLDERASYIQNFAANVSHEFKTPLASIRGALELLEDHIDQMEPAERARFLSMADRHAERLQRLVTRLLDLARADVFQPGNHQTHLLPLLKDIIAHHNLGTQNLRLHHPDHPIHVAMDPETAETLLTNLISNAQQHGGDDVQIDITLDTDQSHTTITVSDNGPGVSAANRSRIFTPFFTTARDHGGTGLGLSVIAALIEAHSGTITLVDTPNQPGATFHITLPATPPTPQTP